LKITHNKTLGSTLLVAGTAIGAGMLALPLSTGAAGFWRASLLFLLCFSFMLVSLFLLMEATLMTKNVSANLISMAKERLGLLGQAVAWLSFLFLLYAVAAAYISGGGSLISQILSSGLKIEISPTIGVWIFFIVFGLIVLFGTRGIDMINRVCITGLIASFILLVIFVTPHIKSTNFQGGDPKFLFSAIPIIILSFTSHIIVPSLRTYLSGNPHKMKIAFFWGSIIPLLFYFFWEFLILGILPIEGKVGLKAIGSGPYPVAHLTEAIATSFKISWISILVGSFSFFALVTSFFGVSLSLFDFFADAVRIKKTIGGRFIILFFTFAPPLFFALNYPSGFLYALGYAGVFVAILYGILPVLMVWKGRYQEKIEEKFQVFGGKPLLFFMFLGSLAIIFFQVAATRGWLPSLSG
ncbi:MAG: amino acid permease, partial [Simkania negevensis]|nr:amino acid permease [Simkania negevensis]